MRPIFVLVPSLEFLPGRFHCLRVSSGIRINEVVRMIDSQMSNLANLYDKLSWTDDVFIEWLQNMKLLHSNRSCDCGKRMRLRSAKQDRQHRNWRCDAKKCKKEKGFLSGTFFEGAHLTLKEIFQLSYFWCHEYASHDSLAFEMRRKDGSTIGNDAVVDHKNFFREICEQYFLRHPTVIGGPGRTVEIDETFVTKRKYNRGRLVQDSIILFGGVERETGDVFMWPVERRDKDTLHDMICRCIFKGTTIISDCWSAYVTRAGNSLLERLPLEFEHLTVNHSYNFVDPDTGAHTQTVESTWQKFKRRHKHEYGTHRSVFRSYVSDFVWRRKFKGEDIMYNLWSQIALLYVCE